MYAPAEPKVARGTIIAGKYRVEHLLGEGGMGAVYAALHLVLRQRVALKLRRPTNDGGSSVARLLNEARAAATLRGEHVVRILDAGIAESGEPFIAMELLEGESLADRLARSGTIPPREAVGYLLEAIEAIAEAHAVGIVHRDLKPSNLFLARAADGSTVLKVLDFGISKALPSALATFDSVTSGACVFGTPSYMAPEQIREPGNVGPAADIWALGVILYELVTGRRPFAGRNIGEVVFAYLQGKPAAVSELAPGVPASIDAAVFRCLELAPAFRFPDAASLALSLADAHPDASSTAARAREVTRTAPPRLDAGTPDSATVELTDAAQLRAGERPLRASVTRSAWHVERAVAPSKYRRPTPRAFASAFAALAVVVALGTTTLALLHRPESAGAPTEAPPANLPTPSTASVNIVGAPSLAASTASAPSSVDLLRGVEAKVVAPAHVPFERTRPTVAPRAAASTRDASPQRDPNATSDDAIDWRQRR